MLHGHTKIELKNEKTGELQVVEKDNMITKALNQISTLQPYFFNYEQYKNKIFPIYSKALGGLLLFSENLEENVDKFILPNPQQNTIIGYSNLSQTVSSDTKKGVFNTTESQQLENGYKYVWDFNTAQGNGQISAIALSSSTFCEDLSAHIMSSSYIDYSTTRDDNLQFAVEVKDDIITTLRTTDDTTVILREYNFSQKIIHILTPNINTPNFKQEKIITISAETNISKNLKWFSGDDGYYYGIYINSSNTCYIRRINKSTLQYDTDYSKSFTYPALKQLRYDEYQGSNPAILDGNVYMGWYNNTTLNILKVNLDDTSITDFKSVAQSYQCQHAYLLPYKGVLYNTQFICYPDLSIRNNFIGDSMSSFSRSEGSQLITDDGYAFGMSSRSIDNTTRLYVIGYFLDYLATINNLDSPVIKTSEQSMKITYTITEE